MQISRFFVNGDIKGAIAYMRDYEEFKDILPMYVAIFEDQKYRTYEIPDNLNEIMRLYQIYFRDTFYCGLPESEAAGKLLTGLREFLNMPDADEALLTEQLQSKVAALRPDTGAKAASCTYERNGRKIWRTKKWITKPVLPP